MTLLDLVPPALALVLNHGGLFGEDAELGAEEIEEGVARAGDGGEELPAGEDGRFTCACRNVSLELRWRVTAFECCGSGRAGAGKAGVDGGEELVGHGCFSERKKESLVDVRGGALRFGIELANGLDLIAEEVDTARAVCFWRERIQDASSQGELAGHLDDVDFGVADGEQMLNEHVRQMLFADPQMKGKGAVEVTREEAHAGGLDRRDDEARRLRSAGGDLPKRCGAGLLDLGVR